MANHGNLDGPLPNDAAKADTGKDVNSGGLSALQADAGVFGPSGVKSPTPKDHFRDDYPIKADGSQAQFLQDEPARMRKHYGLDANASSKDLFDRMGHDSYTLYKESSAEMKSYVRHELGLPGGKTPITEEQFVKAQQDTLRKSVGLDGAATFEQLEKARNQQTYLDAHKSLGDLKIDPD